MSVIVFRYKSERRDLNPRPPLPQSGALPSCATPRDHLAKYSGNIDRLLLLNRKILSRAIFEDFYQACKE